MDGRELLARAGAALNPLLSRDVAEFTAAQRDFAGTRSGPSTVAVVGMTPGEGRTSVAALLALTVAAWSDRRVVGLDAGIPSGPPDRPGNCLTSLLGGDPARGRIDRLLAGDQVVSRRRLRESWTPETAPPVLGAPQGIGGEMIAPTLQRLRHRADLVVIDTPAMVRAPVLPAVLGRADQVVLVARADGDVDLRLQSGLRRLSATPGGPRVSAAVLVGRGWSTPQWTDPGVPVIVLPRDEGLRRRSADRLGRQAMTAGLQLATLVASAARAPSSTLQVAGPPVGQWVGTPPHLEGLREPAPRR